MRVYASTLWLSADKGPRPVLATIASWLSGAERRNATAAATAGALGGMPQSNRARGARSPAAAIGVEGLTTPGPRTLSSGATLDVVYTESGSPYLHAVRYTHRDRTERGRSWVTEVGLRAEAGASEIECSVYLYTDEVSTRIAAPVVATRPMLVRELLRRCAPSARTPGLAVRVLTNANAAELAAHSRSADRSSPLVVVSCASDGRPAADLDRLQDLLAGLATVVRIPAEEDTRALATTFGEGLTPYAGAIAILFPVRSGPYAAPVPVRRLLPSQIDEIRAAGNDVESEIFSLVTERMNVPNARRHLSPDQVNRERARRSIARHAKAGASAEELRLWNGELEAEIARLEDEIRKRDREAQTDDWTIETLNDELAKLKEELHIANSAASAHLAQLSAARGARGREERDLDALQGAFVRATAGSPAPEDSLLLLEAIFADRVVVLDDAYESARESAGFRDGARVLELLCTLAGAYWEALSAGKPDSEARKAFPTKRFAAKESETLSKSGRTRRTFTYKGAPVLMEPHLKVGDTGGSADSTLRIHFHWDAADKRIVIGHCGPHIPF